MLTLRKKAALDRVVPVEESGIVQTARYKGRSLPAAGAILRPEDVAQMTLALDGEEPQ